MLIRILLLDLFVTKLLWKCCYNEIYKNVVLITFRVTGRVIGRTIITVLLYLYDAADQWLYLYCNYITRCTMGIGQFLFLKYFLDFIRCYHFRSFWHDICLYFVTDLHFFMTSVLRLTCCSMAFLSDVFHQLVSSLIRPRCFIIPFNISFL